MLAPHIIAQAPRRGDKFIDLFGGRGSVDFRAWSEGLDYREWIINDLLTAPFFHALRDFGHRIKVPKRSREEFERQRELAKKGDAGALLLSPWLCFNGGLYASGGSQLSGSLKGGRRTRESYQRNLRAAHKIIVEKNPRITALDWFDCLEAERPGPDDCVVIDPPYIESHPGPYTSDSILPTELISVLQSAPFNWILTEYRQPLYVEAFGEPIYQRDVQLKATNFAKAKPERRIECIWTRDSYRAHVGKSTANRDTVTVPPIPVPPGRKDSYYVDLSGEDLLREIRECVAQITVSRNLINAEMRTRLLPALLELRKRTYRKKPSFYETLRSIGLNADTVRQWFYRSHTADEVIDLVEEKQSEPEGGDQDETDDDDDWGGNADEEAADRMQRCLLQADRVVAALLRDKITLAKRLAREYAEYRKLVLESDAQRELKKAA